MTSIFRNIIKISKQVLRCFLSHTFNFIEHAANILGVTTSKEVHFTLFTNHNIKGIPLTFDSPLIGIEKDIPWKFLVHGWTTSPWVSSWYNICRDNYFKKGEYNIVYVDWSKPANRSYSVSVINTKGSGEVLGDLILSLYQNGVPLSQIHLLGHSLGSHMVSFAGRRIFDVINEKIYRITATDPARPLFEIPILLKEDMRLDKNAARFVDVIHTDGGRYGMLTATGHVDFYPNGGQRFQPGCEDLDDANCSHARSALYYAESILSEDFIAREAKNYKEYLEEKYTSDIEAVFGEDIDTDLRGTFYFKTNSKPPFALGKKLI